MIACEISSGWSAVSPSRISPDRLQSGPNYARTVIRHETSVSSGIRVAPRSPLITNVVDHELLSATHLTLSLAVPPSRPRVVLQVSAVWVDWFLEVYMTIMADLEHLGLGPFECANINSMPSGTHALFMAARTCAQINLFGMSYTGDLVFQRSGHVQYVLVTTHN